jgi:hypothetical protein
MLTPDKRSQLIKLLGMLGSDHDGEVLSAAKFAQRLIGSAEMTWEEVLNNAGGSTGNYTSVHLTRRYNEGYQEGFRVGLAKGHASAGPKIKPAPSDWQELAQSLLDDCALSDWETGFCENFIERGWDTPTDKQREVFARMRRKFGLDPA